MQSRYWAFIVYPESVIDNWENILEEKGLQFCISPLHDKDINPTGEQKKAHYHVLVEYEGPKRYKNIKEEICDQIGATIPKKVESLRGYYRYLVHADNQEKAQYEWKDIREYNGFKVDLTSTEVNMIMRKICEIIESTNIKEYSDLMDYFKDIGDMDYWDVASNHTYFFDKYITSKRHKVVKEQVQNKVIK